MIKLAFFPRYSPLLPVIHGFVNVLAYFLPVGANRLIVAPLLNRNGIVAESKQIQNTINNYLHTHISLLHAANIRTFPETSKENGTEFSRSAVRLLVVKDA